MEISMTEVGQVERAANEAEIKQLTELELLTVGGGIGETTL